MEKKLLNNRYKLINKNYIGKGQYGTVYLYQDTKFFKKQSDMQIENDPNIIIQEKDNQKIKYVAMKKLKIKRTGVDFTTLREIKILKELGFHQNIVSIRDIFYDQDNIMLVMDYMPLNLQEFLQSSLLTGVDIRDIMFQLLSAVQVMHKFWVLHRDITPANILIDQNGNICLSDFGLSRYHGSPNRKLSQRVCTIWYRAPELLYGARYYSSAVDIWSVGCIFGQLFHKDALYRGQDSPISQLSVIFAKCGEATEENWPGVSSLPDYYKFEHSEKIDFRRYIHTNPDFNKDACDLLDKMLQLCPKNRITAEEALKHPYFTNYKMNQKTAYRERVKQQFSSILKKHINKKQ